MAEIIAYGVAAIRETFEEAGVFLARKKDDRNDFGGRISEPTFHRKAR